MIEAKQLEKVFSKRKVVDQVSVALDRGEIIGLLGPNGAGKTTTFQMIMGIQPTTAGRVFLDGEDITSLPMYLRSRKGIAYMAQESSVFQQLSVKDNVRLVLEMRDDLTKTEKQTRLHELLDVMGIERLSQSLAYTLSGGEKRRLEVARALANEPKYLLLDEPFAGIDPVTIQEVQSLVKRLSVEWGIGVLITDHNVHATLQITDRAYILIDGKVFFEGTAEDLLASEEVRKLYLGDMNRL